MPSSDRISVEQQRARQLRDQLPSLAASVRVLVVGDIMLDRYWFGDVSRISPEAPVPVVQIRNRDDRLGGAANVARNITALGAQATLVGTIGQDEAGACLKALLAQHQITPFLDADPRVTTRVKLRVLSRQQQMLRIDFDMHISGASFIDNAQILTLLKSHDVLVLSDYAKGVLCEPQALISAARACGVPVLVDPKEADFSRYAGATILKPNMSEFALAAGKSSNEDELSDKAQSLRHSLNVNYLVLTRSEHGMSFFDDQGIQYFPAQVREVFDVCGAGDMVVTMMATLFAAGVEPGVSAWLANRAAGMTVSRLGAAAVTKDELVASF